MTLIYPVETEEEQEQQVQKIFSPEWSNIHTNPANPYSEEVLDSYLRDILKHFEEGAPTDIRLIERAYTIAKNAHTGQVRKSGAPYIIHPLSVALILAEMRMDATTVAAGLLHDTIEDTELTLEDIEATFGIEVSRLVHGVTKIEKLPTEIKSGIGNPKTRANKGPSAQAQYLHQMFMAMGNDVRVILVKLADRLDNMRTLSSLPKNRQLENARETLEIFAPLANRLGIGQMKWQLEDLSFRYMNPDSYKEIARNLAERRADREIVMDQLIQRLHEELKKYNLEAELSGRPKHIYSIYRKMSRKKVNFDQIFDIRAMRVIVKDVPTCYQVLGIIHGLWRPVHGEFDDYIAAPKENGYRSLHTAVVGDDGKTFEVQIRTHDMHTDAEYGIAAHWKYKEQNRSTSGSSTFDPRKKLDISADEEAFQQRINYMRRLLENAKEVSDSQDFVEVIKQTISDDRVYVFTPRNDIVDLPSGSTPIDFAYHIHTEIGHRCRGAKVNGRLVGLDYQLQTSDRVEIMTSNRGGPSLDWLNEDLGFVKTLRARQKIRQWFRKRDREINISAGREAVDRELRRLGIDDYPRQDIAAKTNYSSLENLLEAIGYGDVTASSIVSRLIELGKQEAKSRQESLTTSTSSIPISSTPDRGVNVTGTGGLLVKLATCCHPAPGDAIVGFVTRNNGVAIHRQNCKNIVHTSEPERLINVDWGQDKPQMYSVPIEIHSHDRSGLMRDIGAVVAGEGISMTNVNIVLVDQLAIFSLVMEVHDVPQLSRVLNKLEQLPDVIQVRRRS